MKRGVFTLQPGNDSYSPAMASGRQHRDQLLGKVGSDVMSVGSHGAAWAGGCGLKGEVRTESGTQTEADL